MLKKFLLVLMALMMVFTMIPTVAMAEETGGNSIDLSGALDNLLTGNDNNILVVTDTTMLEDEISFLNAYLQKYNTSSIEFSIDAREETPNGMFTITCSDTNGNMENRNVKVEYDEQFSDDFKAILTDLTNKTLQLQTTTKEEISTMLIQSLAGTNEKYFFSLEGYYDYDEDKWIDSFNEDFTQTTIVMSEKESEQPIILERHVVNLSYLNEPSEEFKKILNTEGQNIIVNCSTDVEKATAIDNYLTSKNTGEYWFNLANQFNENDEGCIITMRDARSYSIVEYHYINVKFDYQMTSAFKNLLNDDGKLHIKSVRPENDEESWSIFYLNSYFTTGGKLGHGSTAEDYNSGIVTYDGETRSVDFVYDYDSKIAKSLKPLWKKLNTGETSEPPCFTVQDMELLNYWINNADKNGSDNLDNYSGELRKLFGYKNISYFVDNRAGDDKLLSMERMGIASFSIYNTIYHAEPRLRTHAEHVIYVPNNTGNSKEELMKAAQKRIDDYIGTGVVKVSSDKTAEEALNSWLEQGYILYKDYLHGMTLDEWKDDYYSASSSFEEAVGISDVNETDPCFTAKIGNKEYYFIIRKDSSKMVTPTYKNADALSNVQVESASSQIPLDTMIEVKNVTSGTEYDRIMKVLDVENSKTFDIKLHSASKDDYVTKLDNGKFEVKIPIDKQFEGKNLVVYYVDAKGNTTEHAVTVKGGFATFETDHFSIYTLAEAKGSSVPKEEIKVDGGKAEVPADVIKDASAADKAEVVITIPKDKEVSEITLPVASVKEVASAKKSLTIETKTATVTLDNKALETVVGKADGAKLTLKIDEIAKTALSEKQQNAIKDIDVDVIISAEILDANGNEVSKDFGGGKATIKLPFTPAEGKKLGDYTIVYIADDGKMLRIPTKVVDGYLVFELEHFSEYAVALSSEVANIPLAGETPKTGDTSGLAGWAVLAVLAAGTAVFAKRRRED